MVALLSAYCAPNTVLSTLQRIRVSDRKAYVLITRLHFPFFPMEGRDFVVSLLSPKCPTMPAVQEMLVK